MKKPTITMTPRLQLIKEPDPTLQQRQAWAWLWRRLLTPENSNAPSGELEAATVALIEEGLTRA